MSTVIGNSSPSPAASPRPSYHLRRSPYIASSRSSGSLKRSPPRRLSYSRSSPRRAFDVHASLPPKQPRHKSPDRASLEKVPRFVDAGTQYSPEGYPPTASQDRSIKKEPQEQSVPGGVKRRKESASPRSPQPMSSLSQTSTTAAVTTDPPPEPELRTQPEAGQVEPVEARTTHGHSSAPKRSQPEPGPSKVMPVQYETCNPKDLGYLVSSMLMELIRINDKIPLRDGRLTRFHSRAAPGISVSDYLQRLIQHATLSPPIILSMVAYIDCLCSLYPAFMISSLTVHRFLITAATVASKGLSDSFWTNPTYARIGGIPVSELATLELEFLQKMQWKIVPKPEQLEEYYRSLVNRTEGYVLEDSSSQVSSSSSSLDESDESVRGSESRHEDEVMADPP